jgi:hypothetical protein
MASLREIITQERKWIGLLVGAHAPTSLFPPGNDKPVFFEISLIDSKRIFMSLTVDQHVRGAHRSSLLNK